MQPLYIPHYTATMSHTYGSLKLQVSFAKEPYKRDNICSHFIFHTIQPLYIIQILTCVYTYSIYICIYTYTYVTYVMGWLRLVGCLKIQVSFAKELYKRDLYSAKRPVFLSILLIVATPYCGLYMYPFRYLCTYIMFMCSFIYLCANIHVFMYIHHVNVFFYLFMCIHIISSISAMLYIHECMYNLQIHIHICTCISCTHENTYVCHTHMVCTCMSHTYICTHTHIKGNLK